MPNRNRSALALSVCAALCGVVVAPVRGEQPLVGAGVGGVVSTSVSTTAAGAVSGFDINSFLGADAFYDAGYTGSRATVASIEAGHIWSGHESLTHARQITGHANSLGQVDRHATWVGSFIAGRGAGVYQRGIAYDSTLYSGALSAQWSGPRYALGFNYFYDTLFDQYRKAFATGMGGAGNPRADVINSSFYAAESDVFAAGADYGTIGLDGLALANPQTLFVAIAGNNGLRADKRVGAPGSGYNNLSVGALAPGVGNAFNTAASFSSRGPGPHYDPVNGYVLDSNDEVDSTVRQTVDIAAPGQGLTAAYYGGQTGGNGTTDNPSISGSGPTGIANGPAGGANFYSQGLAGTSFAAPIVAGGAALIYDAARAQFPSNPSARDARVVKAVLMNSADKTTGWDNGQTPHGNGLGGVSTTQGLDNTVGTGRLNLTGAFDQFLGGTTDVPGAAAGNQGIVDVTGWDFGLVSESVNGGYNDYFFTTDLLGGSTFTATLTWFRDRSLSADNTIADDTSFDDLDLSLWSLVDGELFDVVSESISTYNNSEHFSFALPQSGEYALRVRWLGEIFDTTDDLNQTTYGLAWTGTAIPEPGALGVLVLGTTSLLRPHRNRRAS